MSDEITLQVIFNWQSETGVVSLMHNIHVEIEQPFLSKVVHNTKIVTWVIIEELPYYGWTQQAHKEFLVVFLAEYRCFIKDVFGGGKTIGMFKGLSRS